ncbi:conserved Plasmodium protein, unknown function [Plasmodium sp. gorilla clade G2]|uniref:conserved Plasmodium protein, unknown function n=1 Tax=Plasmodium sp. gorilla clade G2 TaxID=880535 RepID=UPI000D218C1A|nr:conserved Plasmodium protein, unknown function [Plasmodium sp. gorilla clade G2]SOV19638.1 conserved Plasmodium protein, unknown function [Plasmodium sp. gorilla clade G2]
MLCLDKEDELKICKRYNIENDINLNKVKNNVNDNCLKDINNLIDIDDEIIYINTSICNSFIYIISKYCFYIFDNKDFSFVTLFALKYDHVNNFGYHNKVFLSSIDNTIYIISNNNKYVYAYNVENKNGIVILDYDKRAHSLNINEISEEDTSESENEYYEYITYIKKTYKKKRKLQKNITIKLITMLYLPISSNCLMITKNNILFFSQETDKIFISDSVQNILSKNAQKKNNPDNKLNKLVINTKIVSLKSITCNTNMMKSKVYKKENKLNSCRNINVFSEASKFRKVKTKSYTDKNKLLFKNNSKKNYINETLCDPNINNKFLCPKNIFQCYNKIKNKGKKNYKNVNDFRMKHTNKYTKKKTNDFNPLYLYSINKESHLYDFILNYESSDDEKKKKYICENGINIQGISKVEFNLHNDYLLILSANGELYIFSFFYKFFNFKKNKCCYYYGKKVHNQYYNYRHYEKKKKKKKNIYISDENEFFTNINNNNNNMNNLRNNPNDVFFLKKKRKEKKKKNVIGLYIGSSIIDICYNVFRKLILVVTDKLIIKGYNTFPYICKHTFERSIFHIDIFFNNCINFYSYNYLLWNKQQTFFLVSLSKNNYYIFNTNGTLYYSMSYDTKSNEEKNEEGQHIKNGNMQNNNNNISISFNKCENKKLSTIYVENNINDKDRPNSFNDLIKTFLKHDNIQRYYIKISFIFNDFKLCYNKIKDTNYYYLNVKNILYLNDTYSTNKVFNYNSNYYTNSLSKKIYIGINNIQILDTNVNNYNINDHEKNIVKIKQIDTPFKFIKKCYCNFNNTYMLIVYKSLCIYNIQKKVFSYFVDDYMKYFYHNYPTGWLYDDVFFVTCLHNKYDEHNFKHFKKKNDYNLFNGSNVNNEKTENKESAYFEFLNIKYEGEENMVDPVEYIEKEKMDYDYIEHNDDNKNETNIYITNKKQVDNNITNNDHVHILQTNSNIIENTKGGNDSIYERQNDSNYDKNNYYNKNYNVELKIMNYLFNFNHNETDTYSKSFEEYFNINKINIYTKPFSIFYHNLFLRKDNNVFLAYFNKKKKIYNKKEKNKTNRFEKDDDQRKSINDECITFINRKNNEINSVNQKNNSSNICYINNRINYNIEKNRYDYIEDDISKVSCHKENVNNIYTKRKKKEDKKNEFLKKMNNCFDTYKNNICFVENGLNESTKNYEDILNKNNFYYVIYIYNINNVLKFTNYIYSIKFLYRPILTHVYYNNMNHLPNKKQNISSESYLIVLDAFYNLLCFKITYKNKNVNSDESYNVQNIFVLPLNKDNNFIEPRCFYSIFDIYHYIFVNYDNSIYFLNIYKENKDTNNNNINNINNNSNNVDNYYYNFQFTPTFNYLIDNLQIVKDSKISSYYSLPTSIKYMWPSPFFYIYLFYHYCIYVIYHINTLKNKNQIKKKKSCLPIFLSKENLMNNAFLGKSRNLNFMSIQKNKKNKKNSNDNNYNTTCNETSYDPYQEQSTFLDSYYPSPFKEHEKYDKYDKYYMFENILKNKLNEHSLNYQSLIKMKRFISINDMQNNNCITTQNDIITYIAKYFYSFFEYIFINDNINIKHFNKLLIEQMINIDNQQMNNNTNYNIVLKKMFSWLFYHIINIDEKEIRKINKRMNKICKYNFFSIIEEIENQNDACYIYFTSRSNINVISISKSHNKFFFMENLKEQFRFLHSNYFNSDLLIYRHMKLKKYADEKNCHLYDTLHNMGVFVHIICNHVFSICKKNLNNQVKEEDVNINYNYNEDINENEQNKNERENKNYKNIEQQKIDGKEKRKKNIDTHYNYDIQEHNNYSEISYDKINFKITNYVIIILSKFIKLYSSIYSYSTKMYQPIYDNKIQKRKICYIIINIISKYIRHNLFVINMLDMILYESINRLSHLYICAYKIVYNFLTSLNKNMDFYNLVIGNDNKTRKHAIIDITIILLYSLFMSNSYKERNKEILERLICQNILNINDDSYSNPLNNNKLYENIREEQNIEHVTLHDIHEKNKSEITKLVVSNFFNYINNNSSDEHKSNYIHNIDKTKIDLLKNKNVNDEDIYHMSLYLLLLKEYETNSEDSNLINSINFDITSDYVFKINCNIYYIALYLLCILKKKDVFHLYTLLKILKYYCKHNISEVVINNIRKMDPYVSAILIYCIGNYIPHDFMKLCLKNERFNISSLYMINIQNYIGIYDIRKYYCIYFLYLSLKYNIKSSQSLLHYLSILFYSLIKNNKNVFFHWNYYDLNFDTSINELIPNSLNNSDNYFYLLICANNINNMLSKRIIDIDNLKEFFQNINTNGIIKRTELNNSVVNIERNHNNNNNNNNDYIFELTDIEENNVYKKNELQVNNNDIYNIDINLKSFNYKNFTMNKIMYEFLYNKDIITILKKNIHTFNELYTCNLSVFCKNHLEKNQLDDKEKNKNDENIDDANLDYEEIKIIYMKFIILIQNIIRYYIYNMLWFELYYFITNLKMDVLSFFSQSYIFKSNLFPNIFWGICPIDVFQEQTNEGHFYFFNNELGSNKLEHVYKNDQENKESCDHHKSGIKNEDYNNYQKNEENQINNRSNNKNNNEEEEEKKKKNLSYKKCEYHEFDNNSKQNIDKDTNKYNQYINNILYLKNTFQNKEKEVDQNNAEDIIFPNVFFIDIYKSFKKHFNILYTKKKKKKKNQKNKSINKNKIQMKIEMKENNTEDVIKQNDNIEKLNEKYRSNILSYNIYNNHTNYLFLETHFAPSVYKYIPIYNTIKYLNYIFNVCNINNFKYSIQREYIQNQINVRIYNYICNNIIDITHKYKGEISNKKKEKNKNKKTEFSSILKSFNTHKNDMLWFLLRIFLLLKLPIHCLALILYCKNYILLNILFNWFPYLYHIFNYILNMNSTHFLYKRMENDKSKNMDININGEEQKDKKKNNFIIINNEFNKQFCQYCYDKILHYKKNNITPFTYHMIEKVYKKKLSTIEKKNYSNLYDHYISCNCLDNLIFLKKKLSSLRKTI